MSQDLSRIELRALAMFGVQVVVDDTLEDGVIEHSPAWRYVKVNRRMFEDLKRVVPAAKETSRV